MFHAPRFLFYMTTLWVCTAFHFSLIEYRVNLKCLYFIELLGSVRPGAIWESNIFLWYALRASYTVSYSHIMQKYAFHKIIIILSSFHPFYNRFIVLPIWLWWQLTLIVSNLYLFGLPHHITISLGPFNNIPSKQNRYYIRIFEDSIPYTKHDPQCKCMTVSSIFSLVVLLLLLLLFRHLPSAADFILSHIRQRFI